MPKSDSKSKKPVYSRAILHGNRMNKRGVVADYQRNLQHRKVPSSMHKSQSHLASRKTLTHEFGDVVIKAAANYDSPRVTRENSTEMKFTIPNSPNNKNLFEQSVRRVSVAKHLIIEAIREKRMDEDYDHDIELID